MRAGQTNGRGHDVEQAERDFFTAQINTIQASIAALESHMTELFNTKIENQEKIITELKESSKDHDGRLKEIESFKEGHQNWHQDQKELEQARKSDGHFRWEILVAFGGLLVAAAAIFI